MSQAKGMEGMPLPKKRLFSQLNPDPDCEYPTCNYMTKQKKYAVLFVCIVVIRHFVVSLHLFQWLRLSLINLDQSLTIDIASTRPMFWKWQSHNSFMLK